jgi:alpha-1,3-mannosyltransferase
MKIAHVVRQYYPSVGGLEDYTYNLAIEQRAKGHDVVVITLNTDFQTGEQLPAVDQYMGIEIRRVPWRGSMRYPIATLDLDLLNSMDLVHVHAVDFFIDYLSLMKRLGRLQATLVLCTHGGFFHTQKHQWLKKLFFNTVTRFTLSGVDGVICNSTNDQAVFEKIFARCVMVNNGIRLKKFGEGNGGPVATTDDLIYLGRFSSNKRLAWLIEAYAGLASPSGLLKIIGRSKTGDAQQLQALIDKLDCGARVKLLLDIDDAAIADAIISAKATVSASAYEGFGLGVVELMSYGLIPFLSTDPLSFGDFVRDSEAGVTFEVGADNFDIQYQKLIANWSSATAANAAHYARRFSWTAVSEEIFNVYESTLEKSVRAYR